MRRLSFLLLLATAAAPALAADDNDRGRRHQRSNPDAEQSDSRPQRSERAVSRREVQSEARETRVQRREGDQAERQGTMERIREQQREQRELRRQAGSAETDSSAPVRNWRRRGEAGTSEATLQPRERRIRTIPETQPSGTMTQRRGGIAREFEGRPRRDYRDGNYTRWSRTWHRDGRYDWRRWRDRHRSIFRLGFYYDPFGWSYRRWSLGSFLWPSYYSSRYWLHDPWHYRLPPAYGPYRWVRYWDDALLVNIYTGEVVDVIHNFFW